MNNKIGDDTGIKRLRTYKEDVAEALKKEKTTVVKMVLDEQRRREGFTEMPAPSPQKNALLVWLSIILFWSWAEEQLRRFMFSKNRRGGFEEQRSKNGLNHFRRE